MKRLYQLLAVVLGLGLLASVNAGAARSRDVCIASPTTAISSRTVPWP
jgi:hypothetical protein